MEEEEWKGWKEGKEGMETEWIEGHNGGPMVSLARRYRTCMCTGGTPGAGRGRQSGSGRSADATACTRSVRLGRSCLVPKVAGRSSRRVQTARDAGWLEAAGAVTVSGVPMVG